MNEDDPIVYTGTLPEVVVEADRPNRLMFGRMRDAIKAWQERNLYNQEYSGASDYIGAGLGLLGSELARAAANVASLGEYAVREIIPSGITGRPARRYSAYESNPASYALAEAALDVAPIPVVDDVARAIGAARRTATRRAAGNVSDQIVRGATGDAKSYRYIDPRDEGWSAGPKSIIGQMDRADRELFLKEVMDESAENWRRYYQEFPDREQRIADLYESVRVRPETSRMLSQYQRLKQQYPSPNLMVYDYPLTGSRQLRDNVFLPRLKDYLQEMVDYDLMTPNRRSYEIGAQTLSADALGNKIDPGLGGAYDLALDYGYVYPSRDALLHEASHALQGKIGKEMVDEGLGRSPLSQSERDVRRAMSPAERADQDAIDFSMASTYSGGAYEDVVGSMIRKKRLGFRRSLPWDTDASQNIMYNYWKNNKEQVMNEMGISSDFFYNMMLNDIKNMPRSSKYLASPLEISARVGGEFAEKIFRDSVDRDFLKGIDPYNLPRYSDLSQEQRDYMFDSFFTSGKQAGPVSSYRKNTGDDPGSMVDVRTYQTQPVGDEILSGFYNIATPYQASRKKNTSIPSFADYKDLMPREVLWEMFRNATKAIPAVAAGTTAAGYGVSLGNDQ